MPPAMAVRCKFDEHIQTLAGQVVAQQAVLEIDTRRLGVVEHTPPLDGLGIKMFRNDGHRFFLGAT